MDPHAVERAKINAAVLRYAIDKARERTERAEARAEQANVERTLALARADQALARADQAVERENQALARADQAEVLIRAADERTAAVSRQYLAVVQAAVTLLVANGRYADAYKWVLTRASDASETLSARAVLVLLAQVEHQYARRRHAFAPARRGRALAGDARPRRR